MSNEAWLSWGVPALALTIGAVGYAWAWLSGKAFERRYPDSPK